MVWLEEWSRRTKAASSELGGHEEGPSYAIAYETGTHIRADPARSGLRCSLERQRHGRGVGCDGSFCSASTNPTAPHRRHARGTQHARPDPKHHRVMPPSSEGRGGANLWLRWLVRSGTPLFRLASCENGLSDATACRYATLALTQLHAISAAVLALCVHPTRERVLRGIVRAPRPRTRCQPCERVTASQALLANPRAQRLVWRRCQFPACSSSVSQARRASPADESELIPMLQCSALLQFRPCP